MNVRMSQNASFGCFSAAKIDKLAADRLAAKGYWNHKSGPRYPARDAGFGSSNDRTHTYIAAHVGPNCFFIFLVLAFRWKIITKNENW